MSLGIIDFKILKPPVPVKKNTHVIESGKSLMAMKVLRKLNKIKKILHISLFIA